MFVARRSSDLARHVRIHTGSPYACDFEGCTYSTRQSQAGLWVHKRTHTGERPYVCDIAGCTYTGANRSNLTQHKRGKNPAS